MLRDLLCDEVADKPVIALVPYPTHFELAGVSITIHLKEVTGLLPYAHGGHSPSFFASNNDVTLSNVLSYPYLDNTIISTWTPCLSFTRNFCSVRGAPLSIGFDVLLMLIIPRILLIIC